MTAELTDIVRPFGGRARVFRLRIGEIGELETLCAAGIGEIYLRVATQRYRLADLRETIRLGLIGGGAPPGEADMLVGRYVDGRPIAEYLQLAADILTALHAGAQDAAQDSPDEPGKAAGSGGPATSPPSSPPGSSQGSAPTT